MKNFESRGRLLIINGERWRYKIGKETRGVVAYRSDGLKKYAAGHVVKGVSCEVFERGCWKNTLYGKILPSDVVRWITT